MLPYLDGIIVNSTQLQRDYSIWMNIPAEKVRVCPNGIETQPVEPGKQRFYRKEIRNKFGIPDDAVLIINVGRFSQEKGQMLLARAFHRLVDNCSQDKLYCIPFGAFLSGGIDSSLVTGYMAEILEQPVKTFSIGFKESDFSELEYAKKVAEINKTEHHTEIVEAESLGLLPLLTMHYGQPFADSSAIPTYYVSRMARRNVKMVLSGDGGDENFAGYNSYETVLRELHRNYLTKKSTIKKASPPPGFLLLLEVKDMGEFRQSGRQSV